MASSVRTARPSAVINLFDSKKATGRDSQAKLQPVQEGREASDNWTTVHRTKPPTLERGLQTSSRSRQHLAPFGGPPSAAAQARRQAAQPPRNKPASQSHYKQSCLPVNERDPELLQMELNSGKIYPKDDFRPGMIIRGILHEQDYIAASTGSNITITDRNRTESRFGPICTKWRKMIVLCMFQDHYTAVPLFTHKGNGLMYKKKPEEFISIKDHRTREDVPPQNRHGYLVTENMKADIELFDVKSAAHVTYSLPRKYDLPIIKEGSLTTDSLNHLITLFNYYAPRPQKSRK
ncbi:MAG: hypothetical protein Q9212_005464 [Teloschistes hypoglaucus]